MFTNSGNQRYKRAGVEPVYQLNGRPPGRDQAGLYIVVNGMPEAVGRPGLEAIPAERRQAIHPLLGPQLGFLLGNVFRRCRFFACRSTSRSGRWLKYRPWPFVGP